MTEFKEGKTRNAKKISSPNKRPPKPAPVRVETKKTITASLVISPEHENYQVLKDHLCEGVRFKLDEGEFSVNSFEMQGDNLCIWLEEIGHE